MWTEKEVCIDVTLWVGGGDRRGGRGPSSLSCDDSRRGPPVAAPGRRADIHMRSQSAPKAPVLPLLLRNTRYSVAAAALSWTSRESSGWLLLGPSAVRRCADGPAGGVFSRAEAPAGSSVSMHTASGWRGRPSSGAATDCELMLPTTEGAPAAAAQRAAVHHEMMSPGGEAREAATHTEAGRAIDEDVCVPFGLTRRGGRGSPCRQRRGFQAGGSHSRVGRHLPGLNYRGEGGHVPPAVAGWHYRASQRRRQSEPCWHWRCSHYYR